MKINIFLLALVAFFFVPPCQSKAAIINEWEIFKSFPQGEVVVGSIYVTNYGHDLLGVSYTTGPYATLYPVYHGGLLDITFTQNQVEVSGKDISIRFPEEPFNYIVKSVGGGGFYWGDEWVPDGKAVIEDWTFVGIARFAPAENSSIVISAVVSPSTVPEPEELAGIGGLLLLGLGLGRKLFV